MEPNDKELRQQLSRGPLSRNGFDDRLRKRIEDAIDRPARRPSFFARIGWNGAGVAAILSLLLAFGIWQWTAPGPSAERFADDPAVQTASTQDNKLFADANAQIRSVLLLGLRTDQEAGGNVVSRYRTLLIAPQDGQFAVTASGDGIVMPYKQNFWKIEAVTSGDKNAPTQTLKAYQANGKGALTLEQANAIPVTSDIGMVERLTFVGNRYVSVVQNRTSAPKAEFRWVKHIEQLASDASRTAFDPAAESHVKLEEVLKDSVAASPAIQPQTEQWSIIRRTGNWTAAAEEMKNGVTVTDAYAPFGNDALVEISEPLPDEFRNYDTLSISWSQIKKIVPQAEDAFTSPNEDMLAVLAGNQILVYPYQQQNGKDHPLTIPLADGEKIVMAQWTSNIKYVDNWKKQVAAILNPTDGDAIQLNQGN
ncbi:hypothetical protein [Cohnella sp. REN36]|uniref:hypothetical protein n=1 Tax=Cohnella sp. REN36 TaxID=2887347 RepID=UPI001D15D153|nr:hypothetical protein [Cohnella sp. REN36]MCC3376480.1 hypothetical protein [Cohnella sp. REN36]